MRLFSSSLVILVALAGTALARVGGPAPEMASGVVGMMLAAGALYLINRRRRG